MTDKTFTTKNTERHPAPAGAFSNPDEARRIASNIANCQIC
jgi:hypothetical protein